jgi:tRNA/rRNA methyltransferase
MNNLDNIQVILCDTSHQGNVGSTARAMKTMGIKHLTLVNPLNKPDDHAIALSCNASDIILNAEILSNLDQALHNTTIALAMTSRKREFAYKIHTPKEIIPEIFNVINQNKKVAIVFGSEKNGLTIEQQEKCNRIVTIPGNPEYFSLNLAQAVQIMCYEIYSNLATTSSVAPNNAATYLDNQHLLKHIDKSLSQIGYYTKNKSRDRLIRRLQHIINKANLEHEEVDMLHGIIHGFDRTNIMEN